MSRVQSPLELLNILPRARTYTHTFAKVSRMTILQARSLGLIALVLAMTMTVRAMDVDSARSDFPRLDATASELMRDDIAHDANTNSNDIIAVPVSGNVLQADANDDTGSVADMIDWDEQRAVDATPDSGTWDTVVVEIPARPPRRAGPAFYANDNFASMPTSWYSAYASESTNGMGQVLMDETTTFRWTTAFDWVSFWDDFCTMMCLGFFISIFVLIGMMLLTHDDDDDDDAGCKHCKRCKRCGVGRNEIVLRRIDDVNEDLLPVLRSALDSDVGCVEKVEKSKRIKACEAC